jgi:hypothetical protein
MNLPKPAPVEEGIPWRLISRLTTGILIAMGVAAVLFLLRKSEGTGPRPSPEKRIGDSPPAASASTTIRRGAELAKTVCASCHLFPEPQLLDRFYWGFHVLPNMSGWLGISKYDFTNHPGGARVRAARIIPDEPVLSFEDWRSVCSYYLAGAPTDALPQPPREPVSKNLKQFQAVNALHRREVPRTTLIKINSAEHRIYVGDATTNSLEVLNPDGKLLAAMQLDSPPVSLTTKSNNLYVTLIGSFGPSDEPEGKLVLLAQPKQGAGTRSEVLTKLPRPTDAGFADLNGDGREDCVMSCFGNFLGRFSWFESLTDGQHREHILLDRPGAVQSHMHDFNRDGRPDIIVLMAQSREGIYLFLNEGGGKFKIAPLIEQHPAWGFSSLQLVDFNQDGAPDLLVTIGDIGDGADAPPPMKNYHGVRLYLNDGQNNFRENFFYPLNGAYKALTFDFDADGDLDIAAISFYPDYEHSPWESFVYLENKGGGRFETSTLAAGISGRWITMDAGDVDGDGDLDIVLGAYNTGPGVVPAILSDQWRKQGASVLILKNTLRQPIK